MKKRKALKKQNCGCSKCDKGCPSDRKRSCESRHDSRSTCGQSSFTRDRLSRRAHRYVDRRHSPAFRGNYHHQLELTPYDRQQMANAAMGLASPMPLDCGCNGGLHGHSSPRHGMGRGFGYGHGHGGVGSCRMAQTESTEAPILD